MNERIKSLMDRAEYQATKQSGYEDWEVYVPLDSQTVFEKFAELIVKECTKLLDEDSYLMPELGGYAHDMRKMFGVE
jgi:hypothetical protein